MHINAFMLVYSYFWPQSPVNEGGNMLFDKVQVVIASAKLVKIVIHLGLNVIYSSASKFTYPGEICEISAVF